MQADVPEINSEIISETIAIRKNYKLKIADAIIAVTALISNLIIVADNDSDFLKIPSLKYINPTKL